MIPVNKRITSAASIIPAAFLLKLLASGKLETGFKVFIASAILFSFFPKYKKYAIILIVFTAVRRCDIKG